MNPELLQNIIVGQGCPLVAFGRVGKDHPYVPVVGVDLSGKGQAVSPVVSGTAKKDKGRVQQTVVP